MTSTRRAVALVAVIGPAAHDLVEPFVAHYAALGVTEFRLAVHLPPATTVADRERLTGACESARVRPDLVSEGPWRVETNPRLRDELRARAVADWHVLADADEFQFHPGGVGSTVGRCRERGVPFSTGLLVDRLQKTAEPPGSAKTPEDLDGAFPAGSFLTAQVLDGDPRKVTIAHRDVPVDSPGNHFTASRPPAEHPAPMPVHHFKWRDGARDHLVDRARQFAGRPEPAEIRVRREALRAAEWLLPGVLGGSVGVTTFPASLAELPNRWHELSTPVWRYWQVGRWQERAARRRSPDQGSR